MRINKIHIWQSFVLSFCSALFITVIVPVQTYLGNAELFNFSVWDVVSASAVTCIMAFFVIWLVLLVFELILGRLLSVVLLAALICAYFEIGFFSIGLPPLNGEMRAFFNPFRIIIDTTLLLATFVIVVSCYKWIRNYVHLISLAVVVLGVASLFDVHKSIDTETNSVLQDGFCPQLDVVCSVRFSPQRNVIMLILDSTPASLTT